MMSNMMTSNMHMQDHNGINSHHCDTGDQQHNMFLLYVL